MIVSNRILIVPFHSSYHLWFDLHCRISASRQWNCIVWFSVHNALLRDLTIIQACILIHFCGVNLSYFYHLQYFTFVWDSSSCCIHAHLHNSMWAPFNDLDHRSVRTHHGWVMLQKYSLPKNPCYLIASLWMILDRKYNQVSYSISRSHPIGWMGLFESSAQLHIHWL